MPVSNDANVQVFQLHAFPFLARRPNTSLKRGPSGRLAQTISRLLLTGRSSCRGSCGCSRSVNTLRSMRRPRSPSLRHPLVFLQGAPMPACTVAPAGLKLGAGFTATPTRRPSSGASPAAACGGRAGPRSRAPRPIVRTWVAPRRASAHQAGLRVRWRRCSPPLVRPSVAQLRHKLPSFALGLDLVHQRRFRLVGLAVASDLRFARKFPCRSTLCRFFGAG